MESRVVIFAPTGKDAKVLAKVLERNAIECHVCIDGAEVVDELKKGAGALLLVDEALTVQLVEPLIQHLSHQATWSDLPIFLMSHRGLDSPAVQEAYRQFGNVTLFERPLRGGTLVSAACAP